MTIPIKISEKIEKENVNTPGLLDSGAGGKFIDQNYTRKSGFKIQQLEQPLKAFNVDGTENKRGTIKSFVDLDLTIFGKRGNTRLFVTGLGKQKIILGFPWLNEHNPEINWKTGEFSWRNSENEKPRLMKINRKPTDNSTQLSLQKKGETTDNSTPMSKNIDGNFKISPTHTNHEKSDLQAFINDKNDEEELLNGPINPLSEEENLAIQMIGNTEQDKPNIWINAKMTTSQLLHQTHDEKKKVVPLKEQIPEEYHEFLDVFDEKKADRFPEERVWDHKIKLEDRFVPKSFKNYNLTPIEQIELDKFLKENLEKGYI